MKYTFGSGQTAADRLFEISKFFNAHAVEFIKMYNNKDNCSGLDLGCGPGYTTKMLSEAISSGDVTGLDISENFIKRAKEMFPALHFIKHDITVTPFPVAADIAYGRFILSHLKNPVPLINLWVTQLHGNGLLCIDELEDIYTKTEVFKKYLKINTGLVAGQGADLFVGRILGAGEYQYRVLCNESKKLAVPEWRAASWFYPNTVSIWKNDGYVTSRVTEEERMEIADNMKHIMDSRVNDGNTHWIMRRMVFQKGQA